ncbi:MAG: Trk family potassium uptake protein [Anaerolineae bacterium]|nr:Trk family potassium uptake protein [Anaerolineae bacterium]
MISYRQVRQHHLEQFKKSSPARGPQILVLGFALIILIGSVLLSLPIASENGERIAWVDALFTATSATTVTGLVVFNTQTTFSLFGEIVILLLIQVGGVGFITLAVVLYSLIGRRVSLYERNLLSQALGVGASNGVVRLTLTVLFITLAVEFIGALILFTQWVQVLPWPQALYYSIFHAVSSFCNAGFDLFLGFEDPALQAVRDSPISVINVGLLITIGGLGITAVYDLIVWPRERHLSLHTRLILPLTFYLLVIGTILLLLDETFVAGHALSDFPLGQRWLLAAFSVVSSRTAGVTLIPMSDLGPASQLVMLVWMFIGGAPASMGGGVGITTVAVVLITLASNVRGYNDVRVLERTLPIETIFKAVAIITVSTALVMMITLILLLFGEGELLFPIAFEVVSAFSNTGYSLGITDHFDGWGRILLAFTMFWGRLGPLTLVVALTQRDRQTLIHYPEEKIIIG